MIGASVIVDNFDRFRPVGRPDEANAKLPVDPNAVLPAAVTLQRLQLIARRDAQPGEGDGRIELIELALGDDPERRRTGPAS